MLQPSRLAFIESLVPEPRRSVCRQTTDGLWWQDRENPHRGTLSQRGREPGSPNAVEAYRQGTRVNGEGVVSARGNSTGSAIRCYANAATRCAAGGAAFFQDR